MNPKLTKFKLVNHEGMTGLNFNGRTIPLERIDDTLAEKLIGKTHVLERLAEPATAPVVLALAEPTAEAEAPAATKSKK
jgi:hypothetical protein